MKLNVTKVLLVISLFVNIILIFNLFNSNIMINFESKLSSKDTIKLVDLLINNKLIYEPTDIIDTNKLFRIYGYGNFEYFSREMIMQSEIKNAVLKASHYRLDTLFRNIIKIKYIHISNDSTAEIAYYLGNNTIRPYNGICLFRKNRKSEWYILRNDLHKD